MQKTNEHTRGVKAITLLAKKFNSKMGSYKEHYLNENFGYTVKLSNGGIKIPRIIAQDYEVLPSSIKDDSIKSVSDSFWEIK